MSLRRASGRRPLRGMALPCAVGLVVALAPAPAAPAPGAPAHAVGTGTGTQAARCRDALGTEAGGRTSPTRTAEGSFGGLVREVALRLCGPLGPAGALAPTALEAREPERLYTLVTRDEAIRPTRYAPDDLAPLPGGLYEAREEVVAQTEALLEAAREAGHVYLSVTSGFRDHDTQAGTYEDWVRRVGAERADEVSARPGHSEHQLGLAVDLAGACGGYDCFGDSDDGRWVAANAHRFGFLVRYPEGGQEVTGYAYEPWHLRYVGPRAAWAMRLQGEAYWETFAPVALETADGG